jgi:uncharacterized protein YwlG (UPF0340 family)
MHSVHYFWDNPHSLIKRNRPMLDITDETELQKKNGLNLGISLHSCQTTMSIGKNISQEVRKSVFSKIAAQQFKLYHY